MERPCRRPAAEPCEVPVAQRPGEGERAWTPQEREPTNTQSTRGEYQKGKRTKPAQRTDCMEWCTSG